MEVIVQNEEVMSNIKREEEEDSNRKIFEAYAEQVRKTEGYEVTISPPGEYVMSGFFPMDISKEKRFEDYDMCAQLAVNKFNSLFKEKLGLELEFVKVLTVIARPSCVFTFYITFEAKDLADEAKVKTYQTQVLMGIPLGTWEVKVMRPKPSLDEQGCYLPTVPFWKENKGFECPGKVYDSACLIWYTMAPQASFQVILEKDFQLAKSLRYPKSEVLLDLGAVEEVVSELSSSFWLGGHIGEAEFNAKIFPVLLVEF
ncbi:hypothetical protein RHSIM_Rhsim01G0028500 [Rhododendron simsii]|uniref:Uncharacterized protein n=1 Tax=Rhododendron simsii TaxID=118357 RepID=A0A834HII0_RHOSS|nr:hypothetical protein RHSIM_Rhsim01G0028500 [Rhododendron simsii]